MAALLGTLIEKLAALAELRATLMERLQSAKGADGSQFDLSKAVSGPERSFFQIDARVLAICEMADGLQTGEDALLLVPQRFIDNVTKQVDQLASSYQSLIDSFKSIDSKGGLGGLDPEANTAQSENGEVTIQLEPTFQSIWSQSDAVLAAYHPLLSVVQSKGQADFSAFLSAFSAVLEQVHAERDKLSASAREERQRLANLAKEAEADQKKVANLHNQASPQRNEIERLKTESEKDRKTLAEYTSEGTQSITSIRAAVEQAEQLKATIENYNSTFESFQKQLEQRERTITQGTHRQSELISELEGIEQQIKDLNQQAEAMLSGATVAGLAGSYGRLRDELSVELKKARTVFYVAIGFLFASVVPLAMYVFPGLGELLVDAPSSAPVLTATAPELIGQIAARALLLLPAAWFAKFAAGRHAALFKLKEHYAYKYSVASSVEGFKKQAEPFKDAIAATTFFELTFNPADRMDSRSQEERHPNPLMEWVMKRLGATYDGNQ